MRTHFIVAALSASVIAYPLPEEHHDVSPHHPPAHATHIVDPHMNYNPYETVHEYAYAHTPEYHAHADPHAGYEGHTEHDTAYAEHGYDHSVHPEHGHGFISDLRHGLFTEYGFDAMHQPEHLLEPTFLHETPHHSQYGYGHFEDHRAPHEY